MTPSDERVVIAWVDARTFAWLGGIAAAMGARDANEAAAVLLAEMRADDEAEETR